MIAIGESGPPLASATDGAVAEINPESPRRRPALGTSSEAAIIAVCAALGGCQNVPSINVLGAFFPSWMLCAIVGIALTLIVRWVLIAVRADGELGPRVVVYPALALVLGLGTWLLFFRG
jgi:YtcA family